MIAIFSISASIPELYFGIKETKSMTINSVTIAFITEIFDSLTIPGNFDYYYLAYFYSLQWWFFLGWIFRTQNPILENGA